MKISKPVTTLVCLLTSTTVFAAAPQLDLRISSIDGVVNPLHKKEILRRPGKKITLTADVFVKENGKLVPQHAPAEDFQWAISTHNILCDPARPATCKSRGIEVTKEGISFKTFAGTYDVVDDTMEEMTVKVTYVKDKNRKDSMTIVNQTAKELAEESEKAEQELEAIEAESNSGPAGFLSDLFGGSSSDSSADDSPYYDDSYQRQQNEENLRRHDRNRRDAMHRGGGNAGQNWHRSEDRRNDMNRGPRHDDRPSPAPAVSPGSYGGERNHDRGARGGYTAPARPAPVVAPAPVRPAPSRPVPVRPAPVAAPAPARPIMTLPQPPAPPVPDAAPRFVGPAGR